MGVREFIRAFTRAIYCASNFNCLQFTDALLAPCAEQGCHRARSLHHQSYPFCSMHWFKTKADRSFYETVMGFPYEDISIDDEF